MDEKLAAHIIEEHLTKGLSHRKLARKYGFERTYIYRMLKKNEQKQESQKTDPEAEYPDLGDDVKLLKEALRKARLR
jgi:DNA invertase Pin-like site-specific DNA recombinase